MERFFYRASCAAAGLEALHSAEKNILWTANNYRRQVTWPANNRIILSGDLVFPAYQQIPSILTALVDLQNQIPEVLRLVSSNPIKGSLPNSLNKWQKNGFRGAGGPEKALLAAYWEDSGNYIRDLRDVLEHHDMLGDVSFWDASNDPGRFLIFLPDNPEEKSPQKFTYTYQFNAFDVLDNALIRIHRLLDDICLLHHLEDHDHQVSMPLRHAGELKVGEERTLGLLMEGAPQRLPDGQYHLSLSTTEIKQIIPTESNSGNVSIRKLKLDSELENNRISKQ